MSARRPPAGSPAYPIELRREAIPAWAWAALAAVLALRLALLAAVPLELYPDEAQYWGWAQDLSWGYVSKPPLIAALIAATTGLFGDAEWAVRLAAPLCHTATAALLLVLGRDLYGLRAGLIAACAWIVMPGAALSSVVISTDAPLLALWSLMLLSLFRLMAQPAGGRGRWVWAVALGAAVGGALLAKYAMLYGLLALGICAVLDRRARTALVSAQGALAAALAAAMIAPNLVWNARNDMATVAHTRENAAWAGDLLNPGELITFWIDQLGVFGFLTFPLLVAAAALAAARRMDRNAVLLSVFVWTPLAIVSVEAFIARAHANWAAAMFPAGAVLMGALLTGPRLAERRARALTAAALGVNLIVVLALSVTALSPGLTNAVGLADAVKRVRGWEATTDALIARAQEGGYATLAMDDRFVFHAMDYYARDRAGRPRLTMWLRDEAPGNQAERCCALPADTDERVLLVSRFEEFEPWFAADFAALQPEGELVIPLGGGEERRLRLFAVTGYRPVAPREAETPPGAIFKE